MDAKGYNIIRLFFKRAYKNGITPNRIIFDEKEITIITVKNIVIVAFFKNL